MRSNRELQAEVARLRDALARTDALALIFRESNAILSGKVDQLKAEVRWLAPNSLMIESDLVSWLRWRGYTVTKDNDGASDGAAPTAAIETQAAAST